MEKYQCHKVVEAAKITAVGGAYWQDGIQIVTVATFSDGTFDLPVAKGMPQVNDYVVRYEDGYVSWSPAKPFEDGYTLITA